METEPYYQRISLMSPLPPDVTVDHPVYKAAMSSMTESFKAYYDLHEQKGCVGTKLSPPESVVNPEFEGKVRLTVSANLYCDCYAANVNDAQEVQ